MAYYGIVEPDTGDHADDFFYEPDPRLEWPLVPLNWEFTVHSGRGNIHFDSLTHWCAKHLKGPWAVNTVVDDHTDMNEESCAYEGAPNIYGSLYTNNEKAGNEGGWGLNIKTKADRARFTAEWSEWIVETKA